MLGMWICLDYELVNPTNYINSCYINLDLLHHNQLVSLLVPTKLFNLRLIKPTSQTANFNIAQFVKEYFVWLEVQIPTLTFCTIKKSHEWNIPCVSFFIERQIFWTCLEYLSKGLKTGLNVIRSVYKLLGSHSKQGTTQLDSIVPI